MDNSRQSANGYACYSKDPKDALDAYASYKPQS